MIFFWIGTHTHKLAVGKCYGRHGPLLRALPGCEDDEAVAAWLVREHGVCIIPGSACGARGYVRVAFANLLPSDCRTAAARLRRGLEQLVAEGPTQITGPGAGVGPRAPREARGSQVLPA